MTLAEAIYEHSCKLPEPVAREALDFVVFLEQRYGAARNLVEPTADTEAFIAAVTGGLSDDFPDDIGDSDLGIDAARAELD
jgi:hypothetical protein